MNIISNYLSTYQTHHPCIKYVRACAHTYRYTAYVYLSVHVHTHMHHMYTYSPHITSFLNGTSHHITPHRLKSCHATFPRSRRGKGP